MGGVPSIQLTYFDIQGVAEKVRLALALQQIEFEDKRVEFKDWGALKATTKYGQLPEMTVDGKLFTQSDAMLRFVARLKSKTLYPKDDVEQLRVDEALGLVADFLRAWTPCLYIGMKPSAYGHAEDSNKTEEGKARTKAMREKFVTDDLPRWMGYFTTLIGESAFLCGKNVTIADLALLPAIARFQSGDIDFVAATSLDAFPKIIEYINRIKALPQIVQWYAPKPAVVEEPVVEEKKEQTEEEASSAAAEGSKTAESAPVATESAPVATESAPVATESAPVATEAATEPVAVEAPKEEATKEPEVTPATPSE